MCLQIQVNFDLIDSRHISRWRNSLSLREARRSHSPTSCRETDSIICPLREAPVATKPLLELKPIEGGDAQGTLVLSEKSGVELLENPIPGVRPPPWPLPTLGMAQCRPIQVRNEYSASWQWDGKWRLCQKGHPAGYQEVKCPTKRSYSSNSI